MDNYNRVIYTTPYDSEVEYLESTGTQYLNLGRIPWDKEILFETQTAYTRKYGVGREGSSNALYMGYNENRYETAWMTYYGTLDDNYHIISKKLSYKYNPQKLFSYIDGEEVFIYDMVIEKDSAYAYDLLVFAICGLDGPGFYMHCKKKSFKVIVDEVTVHDLIPVRIGQIGYMYDKITGKLFGNKGTGNFILGNDVNNPVPKIRNVVYSGVNRCVMPMPYDSRVEYLELTGTQWLDTGYYGDINTAMECVCKVTDTTYGYVIAGSRTSPTVGNISFVCGKYDGSYKYMCDFCDYTYSRLSVQKSDIDDYVKLYTSKDLRKGIDVVSGTEYTNNYIISNTEQTPYTIKIGCHDNNYPAFYKHFRGRIKSFKLWNADILLLDLIPVRIGQIGYMYDKVTGNLFGNSGTGQFILGQDIND